MQITWELSTDPAERRILSSKQVCEITNLSRFQIDRMERRGRFPQRRRVSENRVGWFSDEIATWLEELPVGGAVRPAKSEAA